MTTKKRYTDYGPDDGSGPGKRKRIVQNLEVAEAVAEATTAARESETAAGKRKRIAENRELAEAVAEAKTAAREAEAAAREAHAVLKVCKMHEQAMISHLDQLLQDDAGDDDEFEKLLNHEPSIDGDAGDAGDDDEAADIDDGVDDSAHESSSDDTDDAREATKPERWLERRCQYCGWHQWVSYTRSGAAGGWHVYTCKGCWYDHWFKCCAWN